MPWLLKPLRTCKTQQNQASTEDFEGEDTLTDHNVDGDFKLLECVGRRTGCFSGKGTAAAAVLVGAVATVYSCRRTLVKHEELVEYVR